MQFLTVSHSRTKPNRYFIDGRRVSRDCYWDVFDDHHRRGWNYNSSCHKDTHHRDGSVTRRAYCSLNAPIPEAA